MPMPANKQRTAASVRAAITKKWVPPNPHRLPAPSKATIHWNDALARDMGSSGTNLDTGDIYMLTNHRDPFTTGHELGHALANDLSNSDKLRLSRLMGMKGQQWTNDSGLAHGTDNPEERFADYYGALISRLNPKRGESVASYVADWKPKMLTKIADELANIRRRNGLQRFSRKDYGLPKYQSPAQQARRRQAAREQRKRLEKRGVNVGGGTD